MTVTALAGLASTSYAETYYVATDAVWSRLFPQKVSVIKIQPTERRRAIHITEENVLLRPAGDISTLPAKGIRIEEQLILPYI